ncbi:polysaccharide biosynthesis/export family protein [Aureimonas mangrovi]|uniref:polysaccharide biosynthesis/export family protein n=1 Tax=Aureimonas mangrovi TaxID=2758041 RepID=UPI00163DC6DD|nr:polysaccharide biosynthesis/export family protein [Aureimonas mangrovi]
MSYEPVPQAFHEGLSGPYHLDTGDRVRVTVFEEEGITNSYSVDQAGYLSLPLVGTVPARGKTTRELQAAVAGQLRQGFLRDPDVSVEVEQYRPFFIMGEVQTGGQYSYVPGMTVQNAIAVAGGFSSRANQKSVDITRQVAGQVITGRVLTSDPIVPGDTIYVRERLF